MALEIGDGSYNTVLAATNSNHNYNPLLVSGGFFFATGLIMLCGSSCSRERCGAVGGFFEHVNKEIQERNEKEGYTLSLQTYAIGVMILGGALLYAGTS